MRKKDLQNTHVLFEKRQQTDMSTAAARDALEELERAKWASRREARDILRGVYHLCLNPETVELAHELLTDLHPRLDNLSHPEVYNLCGELEDIVFDILTKNPETPADYQKEIASIKDLLIKSGVLEESDFKA